MDQFIVYCIIQNMLFFLKIFLHFAEPCLNLLSEYEMFVALLYNQKMCVEQQIKMNSEVIRAGHV